MPADTICKKAIPAFTIACDGCTLPAVWLPDAFVPRILRDQGEQVRFLAVLGYKTPSDNIKYLPAKNGVQWLLEQGLTGSGKKVYVPSSGNFLISTDQVVKEKEVKIEITGVVSSRLPAGKRRALEQRNITLVTERDLAAQLGLAEPGETFEMLRECSRINGIPVLDQYDCEWNRQSYIPIAEEVPKHVQVSLVVTTAGTKGKYHIGEVLRITNPVLPLVVAFPYPGEAFPGGRGEDDILRVRNEFIVEPIRRHTDQVVAYHRAALLNLEGGVEGGITFGAEVATAQHYLLEMLRRKRLRELYGASNTIVVLVVCSDMIYPYLDEGMEYFPHLYSQIKNLRQ